MLVRPLLLALFLLAPAGAVCLEVKGLSLGMTRAEVETLLPGIDEACVWSTQVGAEQCAYVSSSSRPLPQLRTVADAVTRGWQLRFRDGRLSRVVVFFHSNWTIQVADALEQKLGPPSSGDGLDLRVWDRAPAAVTLTKALDALSLEVTGAAETSGQRDHKKQRAKKAARDF